MKTGPEREKRTSVVEEEKLRPSPYPKCRASGQQRPLSADSRIRVSPLRKQLTLAQVSRRC